MKLKKKIIIAVAVSFLSFLIYWNRLFFLILFSNAKCYFTPVDYNYVIAREWLSESGGVIIFNAKNETLKNDTVFRQDIPYCRILRLNKQLNEITVYSFDKKKNITYTSTEEFRK
ncbi:MAG: hypothetical protein JST20_02140 [Bacteroidetes bacterium]|nr:hypothetical protein [Bacteroidota bacterium]